MRYRALETGYIYIDGEFKSNLAVIFDTEIIDIDRADIIESKYGVEVFRYPKTSILYPGFINTHTHLEFSANRTTLKYGSFLDWLYSVIENREDLVQNCTNSIMFKSCQEMLSSGVTTFGAISSFGVDLEVCRKTPQKVIYFNELIGSNPAYVDMLYSDFINRVEESKRDASLFKITPSVAIHAPYSVHPVVLKRALEFAKENRYFVTAHLLESKAERDWLECSGGEFLKFFQKYFNSSCAVTSIREFIDSFKDIQTHFVHLTDANYKELKLLKEYNHSIAHSPRSNRLLGCGRLDLLSVIDLNIPFTVATDGLSSNYSLNIFDELRTALFMHYKFDLNILAKLLIDSVTINPAKIFNLNRGEIAIGREADFAIINLPDIIREEDIALWTILHTEEAITYIDGERVNFVDG